MTTEPTLADFETMVQEELSRVPERYLKRLSNVAFLVEEAPRAGVLEEQGLEVDDDLLGLYHGIPLTERGAEYGVGLVLPDTITIYRKATLKEAAGNFELVPSIVRDTLWHEIAHYFGFDEAEVMLREDGGTNTYRA